MSEELRMLFKAREVGSKWQSLGQDGNGFDRSTAGREQAWHEAQAAASLGLPWAGATFRLVDVFEGDHADDCVLGLDADAWCDCGVELVIVEERVLFASAPGGVVETEGVAAGAFAKLGFGAPYGRFGVVVTDVGELDRRGLGGLVVEGVLEPKDES